MKKYINYSRDIPTVNFDNNELEGYMIDFMVENFGKAIDVNRYLGLVMLRLGFKSDDFIEFRNYNRDNREEFFLCKVNDNWNYNIKFLNVGNKKLHSMIILTYFNKEITFECFPLRLSELGVRIIPVKERIIYEDGISFTRELSRENVKFVVEYSDYKLELGVVKPIDYDLPLYDKDGSYSRYRLDNEDVLNNYLNDFFKIVSNGDIVSIYKKICEISLGYDVSIYPEVKLVLSYRDKITDIIHLKNGELEKFGVTLLKLGRSLFLDKNGDWIYEVNDFDDLFKIEMAVRDEGTSYNIFVKNEDDLNIISETVYNDTKMVKRNIEYIKRLVRRTFYNGDKDSN